MKNRFSATVLVWSLASFGVTAALYLPGQLQATGPVNIQPLAAMPTSISTDHIDLSLKLAGQTDDMISPLSIQPGESPKFKLEAKNKTGVALTIPVKISMSSMVLASRASRVPPMPKEIWSYQRDLTLAPGKTDSIDISSDIKPGKEGMFFMTMTAGDKTVYPFNLVVKSSDAK